MVLHAGKGKGFGHSNRKTQGGGTPSPANILNRAPTANDDTAIGYLVDSIWTNLTSGTVYKATSVSAGAAVWAAQSPSLPLDTLNPAGTAGYSVRYKLLSAYAGYACRLQRLSDSVTFDVGFSGNAVDSASAVTWINSKSDTYRVVTVYDQSGNALDATQGTFASAPIITAAGIATYGGIYLDMATGSLNLPAGYSVASADDHTGFCIWRTKRSVTGDALYQVGTAATSSLPMARGAGAYSQGPVVANGQGMLVEFDKRMVGAFTSRHTGPAERRVRIGNDVLSGIASFANTGAVTGGTWGKNTYQSLAGYSLHETLILLSRSATTAEEASMMVALHAMAQIAPQYDRLSVYDGDSKTQGYPWGQGAYTSANDYLVARAHAYRDASAYPVKVHNMGVQGNTLVQRVTAYSAANGPKYIYKTGKKKVYYIWAGSNDIVTGATGATTYTNLKSFCTTLIADGWQVVTSTIMYRTDLTAGQNTERLALNTSIQSGELAGMGVTVIDLAALYDNSLVTLVDGVHETVASYAYEGGTVEKPVLDALLA